MAAIGLFNLFRGIGLVEITHLPFVGGIRVPGPLFRQGTWPLLFAFALLMILSFFGRPRERVARAEELLPGTESRVLPLRNSFLGVPDK